MSDNNKSRILRGAAWISAARAAIILLGFASTILLARYLTPDDFGLIAIATAAAMTVTAITELSLSQALVQHDDPQEYHYNTVFTLNLIKAVAAGALVAAVAYPAALIYGDDRLFAVLLGLALAAFVGGFENPKLVALQKDLLFWQEFIIRVSEKLIGFVVVITIAIIYQSYWAFVIGAIVSGFGKSVISYFLIPYRPRLGLRGTQELLSYSIWLTLSHLVATINTRSDPIILGLFVPTGRLGFFTFADNIARMPAREGLAPLRFTLFPAFAKLKHETARLRTAYVNAQGVIALLAFPLCLGLSSVAEPTTLLLFGEKWMPAAPIIAVLAAAMALQSVSGLQPLAMALGKTRQFFNFGLKILIVRLALLISSVWIGDTYFDAPIEGALVGAVASVFATTGWSMFEVRRFIDLSIARQIGLFGNAAFSAVCMWLAVTAAQRWIPVQSSELSGFLQLTIHVAVGGVTYLALVGLVWALRRFPEGPERELFNLTRSLIGKLMNRQSANG